MPLAAASDPETTFNPANSNAQSGDWSTVLRRPRIFSASTPVSTLRFFSSSGALLKVMKVSKEPLPQ
jgi:hypothetical protein